MERLFPLFLPRAGRFPSIIMVGFSSVPEVSQADIKPHPIHVFFFYVISNIVVIFNRGVPGSSQQMSKRRNRLQFRLYRVSQNLFEVITYLCH